MNEVSTVTTPPQPIEAACRQAVGTKICLRAMLVKKETLLKVTKEEYLVITVQDRSGTLVFPVWSNIESRKKNLAEGKVYLIEGMANLYNASFQVKDPMFKLLENEDASQFLPSFQIPEAMKQYFATTVEELEEPWRSLVEACIDRVHMKAFQTAPAAVKHHHNRLGGLFLHTCGVLKNVDTMIQNYCTEPFWDFDTSEHIEPSRLRAKAILHDLMKVKEYSYETAIARSSRRQGHITLALTLLGEVNAEHRLLSDEQLDDFCYSIQAHHGPFGGDEPKTLEDNLLFLADMIDARAIGFAQTSIHPTSD